MSIGSETFFLFSFVIVFSVVSADCTAAKIITCSIVNAQWLEINKILVSCDINQSFEESQEISEVNFTKSPFWNKSLDIQTASIKAITFQNNTPLLPINIGRHFQNVLVLHACGRNLTKIQKETFTGLRKLEYLYLHDNQIAFIEHGAFEHVPSLKILSLQNNKLREIDVMSFNSFIALEVLDLSNNGLNGFKDSAISTQAVKSINMTNNTLSTSECLKFIFNYPFSDILIRQKNDEIEELSRQLRKFKYVDYFIFVMVLVNGIFFVLTGLYVKKYM